ncbi:hypothetical protein HB662_10170 [Roseomonas frigidaquae]|uniref:Tyr recombinase domain-containing protein n=1 Tax=Falsiroseomonas frigidaquae TaxID=487318 RepID=A0ABX1EYJ3_9PROT|nr:hypothetical protein [Falsiroseomonas frigidaquae]NKE45145.1 hypothetical protein [Falsiroseomonas frigidaquae]
MTESAAKLKIIREAPKRLRTSDADRYWRQRAPGQRLVVAHPECPGLALVIHAKTWAWVLSFKPRGRDSVTGKRFPSTSMTLGSPEQLSPEDAKDKANAYKGQQKSGVDLAGERRSKLEADAKARSQTVERLLDRYKVYLPTREKRKGGGTLKSAYVTEDLACVEAAFQAINALSRPVGSIGKSEILAILKHRASEQKTGRRWFQSVSRFLDWVHEEEIIDVNPCELIPKNRRPKKPKDRKHYLSVPELAAIWKAAGTVEGLNDAHRDLQRFIIAVPCRVSEARLMRWEHVNLVEGIWMQPDKMTSNEKAHRIYLPSLVCGLLAARHEAQGKPKAGWVFPGPRGKGAITGESTLKARMEKASGLTGWWNHDVRRSFVTVLSEEHGHEEAVLDLVLNHKASASRPGVMGTYQRAEKWNARKQAMVDWCELLDAHINPVTAEHLPENLRHLAAA